MNLSNEWRDKNNIPRDFVFDPDTKSKKDALNQFKTFRYRLTTKACHFLLRSFYSIQGAEKAWKVGEVRYVNNPERVELCYWGYHSSPDWWSAFALVDQPVACRVLVSTPVYKEPNKQVSVARKLVEYRNITEPLIEYIFNYMDKNFPGVFVKEDGKVIRKLKWPDCDLINRFNYYLYDKFFPELAKIVNIIMDKDTFNQFVEGCFASVSLSKE